VNKKLFSVLERVWKFPDLRLAAQAAEMKEGSSIAGELELEAP